MAGFNPMNLAVAALNANPKFKSKPMAQELLRCIQNNDQAAGIAMANNILQSYGLDKEQAVQQAQNGLAQMFHLQ